jgi:hypothetical protein
MNLRERARAWRAERRRRILWEALGACGGGAVAAVGALALLDRLAALPRGAREAGLAAAAAWLAWSLARRLVRPWRALDFDAVFAEAARAWPQTGPVFASAWALSGGPARPGTSEELRAGHLARADRLAASLPARLPPPRRAPSAGRRGAALAAAVLAANALWGDRASWVRAAAPWRDPSLERWVAVAPGDARVPAGAAAEVSARPRASAAALGLRASALRLEARGADGAWRPVPWTRVDAGEAVWRADALGAPLEYRVLWRDLAGAPHRLTPVSPPRWSRAEVVVRGPRGARRFTLGEDAPVRARRGDWIELAGTPAEPLASASARLSGRPRALVMRRDGGRWTAGFAAQSDATLTFDLTAADGRRDPSPPEYALSVAPDAPPTAELLSPQVPLVASPQDRIVAAWAARDDGAVARAELVVRVPGRADRTVPLAVPSPPRGEALGEASFALTGLPPGARARFWVRAWDDASPPQTGRSAEGSVEIVDAQADHAAALAARDAADAALRRAAESAEGARDASRAGTGEAARAAQERLKADWAKAERLTAAWAKAAQADPLTDPGLADEAARGAEEVASAGRDGLPAADAALARRDGAEAARRQDALADQARGALRALRDGAKAQTLQDLAGAMARAGREGDDLAGRTARLAERGKDGTVSAAEMEALKASLDEVRKALDALAKAVKSLPELSSRASAPSREFPMTSARAAASELQQALARGDLEAAADAARRLAEQLRALARSLDQAGRAASRERGRRASQAASEVSRAWRAAEAAQVRAVDEARRASDARGAKALAAQKELLARAAAELSVAVATMAARGSAAWPPGALAAAARARAELAGGLVPAAALSLRDAAARLRGGAGASPGLAARLDALGERLQRGPPPPPPDPAGARPAAEAQAAARTRTASLRDEIRTASRELGYAAGGASARVEDALDEQGRGETALRRGGVDEGLRRAEAALALLQKGRREAESAAAAAAEAAGAMGTAGGAMGGVRAAPAGATGSVLGVVRLPSADEYRPPARLREELERSLSEPRPEADAGAVKEYLKRLAR